jgi:hypothetical protein
MERRLIKLLVLLILPFGITFSFLILNYGGNVSLGLDYFSTYTQPYYNMRFMAATAVAISNSNAAIERLNLAIEYIEKGMLSQASQEVEEAGEFISAFEEALLKVEEEIYSEESRQAYSSMRVMLDAQKECYLYLKQILRKARTGEDYSEEMRRYNRAAMRYMAHASVVFEFQKHATGVVVAK